MPKKLWQWAGAILLLIPSIWVAWEFRDLPHLGKIHDDALYLVGAKSIAEGTGYRISSLPGQPFQTKYPPLFPAYLALGWKLHPDFPANLPWLMLMVWACLPAYLGAAWLLLRTIGLEDRSRVLLLGFLAFNPYSIFIAVNLLTELFSGTILMLALWASVQSVRRPGREMHWAAAAGVLTGIGFLSRTAFAPLFIAIPVWFAIHRHGRPLLPFAALSVPPVLWWTWWSGAHRLTTSDPTLLYYTNYFGLYLRNLDWEAFQMMLWKNSSLFLSSTGRILFPNSLSNDLLLNLSRCLGIMSWFGLVRLWRREGPHPFFLFTVIYTLLMIIWNYPPDERLVFPVMIALGAGFATEARFLGELLLQTWRTRRGGEKALAGAMAAFCGCIAVLSLWQSLEYTFRHMPAQMTADRRLQPERRQGYEWIRRNTPAQAVFMAWNDSVFYLHTGRPALRLAHPAKLYYVGDPDQVRDYLFQAKRFANEHRVDYVFMARDEVLLNSPDDHRDDFWRIARDRATGPPLWLTPHVRILRATDFPDVALEFQSEKKLARSDAAAPGSTGRTASR